MSSLIKLMRPKHWLKNGFVLAPLIFSGEFVNLSSIWQALLAMVFFSVAASASYIFNDYHDIENDRKSVTKLKERPLASGLVTKKQALILLGFLYGVLVLGFFLQPRVIFIILVYLGLNVAYTLVLKHQPVVDIFTIASGFVLRVYAGAMALFVPVSSWMFVTSLCLALYLAAVKRRQELLNQNKESRKVLEQYTLELIDRYAEMSAIGALLFYSLFVITARSELVVTIPFVLFGLFRYWFVVECLNRGESPTDALLSDWQLFLTILIWMAVCIWVLWPTGV